MIGHFMVDFIANVLPRLFVATVAGRWNSLTGPA